MRKKSTRLLSAALAACMMLSALPVGAFAAEPGTEPENAVTAQEEVHTLNKNGDSITTGGTYTMGGPYTGTITVNVENGEDVIINITDDVTTNIDAALIKVVKGHVTINGGTHSLKNTSTSSSYSVTKPLVYLTGDELNTTVEINDGTYVENGPVITCFNKNGTIVINNGTFESSQEAVIDNIYGTIRIEGGTFNGTGQTYAVLNDANSHYEKNTKTIINNGDFTTSGAATINADSGELYINGGTYKADRLVESSAAGSYDAVVHVGSDTFARITDGTFKTGATVGYSRALEIQGNTPDVEVTGGVFEAAGPNPTGIFVDSVGSGEGENIKIENATIRVSGTNGCGVRNRVGHTQLTLKNITIENVGASGDFSDILLDNYYLARVDLEITEDFTHKAVVDATQIVNGLQVTTKTATNYQKDLKLVSANPDYIIAYQKDGDGEFRYFNKRETGRHYVNAINATASIDGGTVLEPYAQLKEGTPVKLTADIPEGKKFTDWKVEKIAADGVTEVQGVLVPDSENPETATLTVPNYDVFVTAEYEDEIVDPGTGDDAADNIKGALSAVVVGAAAGVIIYEAGTGIYRVINMPGIPMPSDRIELAELLWEHAGKPEPVSTALYSDIDEGDTDAQKAAHWAVEQDLMQDDEDDNEFHPHFPVSKLRTCLTWNAAKEKGLFDTDKPAE